MRIWSDMTKIEKTDHKVNLFMYVEQEKYLRYGRNIGNRRYRADWKGKKNNLYTSDFQETNQTGGILEDYRLRKQVGNTSETVEKANIGGIATGCFCI